MEKIKALLKKLTAAQGTPGDEKDIAAICSQELQKYADVKTDALGNVIGETGSGKKHIMLDAHMDRIGFLVTAIDKTGFLRIASAGANDARLLAAAEVTVYAKKKLFGVITSTPPHLSDNDGNDAKSIDKLSVDLGLPYDEVIKTVSPGDRISLNSSFTELLNNRVCAPALDDRAGIAVILRALEKLKNKNLNCKISSVFSSREEVGGSGAAAAAFTLSPDEAIAVDVSFAAAPGVTAPDASPMGGGVIIGCAPVLDFNMFEKLKKTAEINKIPYSTEINGRDSGSDADEILTAGKGVKTAVLFVPQRNMHSAVEIVEPQDIEYAAELIAQYILNLGRDE